MFPYFIAWVQVAFNLGISLITALENQKAGKYQDINWSQIGSPAYRITSLIGCLFDLAETTIKKADNL
jgi:hypothetical protein